MPEPDGEEAQKRTYERLTKKLKLTNPWPLIAFLILLIGGIALIATLPKSTGEEVVVTGTPLKVEHQTGLSGNGSKANFGYRVVFKDHVFITHERALQQAGRFGTPVRGTELANARHMAHVAQDAIDNGLPVTFTGNQLLKEGQPVVIDGKNVVVIKKLDYKGRSFDLSE